MNSIDETTLLQFAAAELDADREATFLAQCEIAPAAWRAAVIAIVEHRRMVEALGELAAEEFPEAAVGKSAPRGWRIIPLALAAMVAGIFIGLAAPLMTAPARSPLASGPSTSALRQAKMPEPTQRRPLKVEKEPAVYLITTADGARWTVPVTRTTLEYVRH